MSIRFMLFAAEQGFADADLQMYARDYARTECFDDRTKQADKDACDINKIVERNIASGILPQTKQVPQFMDISEMGSLQDALETVRVAGEFFMGLPSRTREAFGNDPARFVTESEDPRMFSKFQRLGLAPKDEAPPATAGGASGTVVT